MIGVLWLALGVGLAADDPLERAAADLSALVRSPEPSVGAFDEVVGAIDAAARGLTAPVDDRLWVSVLLDLTVARFQLRGRDWRASRVAAWMSRPDMAMQVGPSLEALRAWAPPALTDVPSLPYGRQVWLDGRRRAALPELTGLHLVQGTRCDVWSSRWVEGAEAQQTRQTWYADCPAAPWRRRDRDLLLAGAGLVGAGAVAVGVSWALARPWDPQPLATLGGDPLTSAQRGALRGANIAGWGALATGTAVAITGAVLRGRHARRSRARP